MIRIIASAMLFMSIGYSAFSQEVDDRLLVKYSKSEIREIQKKDPQQYQFLLNALNKGMFIADIPQEKASGIVFDGTLAIDPEGQHTYLSLGKEILDRYQYFRIEGTNKMVVIQPKIFLDPKTVK